MSLAQLLSTYLNMNLLILIGFFGLGIFSILRKAAGWQLSSQSELRLHYSVLLAVIALTLLQPFLPRNEIFAPAAKVWSAESIKSFGRDYSAPDKGGYLSLPTPTGNSILQADQVAMAWTLLGALLLLCGGIFLTRDLRDLFRIQKSAFLIRQIGHVRIFISETIRVPFSFWLPGQANVIVPSGLLEKKEDYTLAVAHEIQHHRHADTKWVYVLWGLRLVCVINPAIHFWNRWIMEIQEFACDEVLVGRNKVDSQAYARCLVEVAQSAVDQKFDPVCATGLTFLVERNLLKRRIEKMLSQKSIQTGWKIGAVVGVVLASVMGATAYASKSLVQDRRVSLAQAQALAQQVPSNSDFPIVVNEAVLKQLNRYVGTPEGRDFMRASIERMQNYKTLMGGTLQKYSVPAELLAVPLIESGYQNMTEGESHTSMHSAGMWQFTSSTARNFDLRVDGQKDERLDVALSTDAAVRYLQSNHLRFKDWQLAVLAYNMGENAVQGAIDATGSRDVWTLIQNGYEGDKDYLAKIMAAVLILKNPDCLK
jgi:membrane-bound lytic murein transglycosylase D